MKNRLVVVVIVLWGVPVFAQHGLLTGPRNVRTSCDEQKHALESGVYADCALKHVWPPALPLSAGVSIAVQLRPAIKLLLHTDGSKFELWVGTAQIPKNNVLGFLEDLANSCKLPTDPANAVKLLNIGWEVKEVQRARFDQLHDDFLAALTEYTSSVKERTSYFMDTRLARVAVDATRYTIFYDNSWQHFEIQEWDLPINGQVTPMVKWTRELEGIAEQSFHRSFVGK
jgi:hypothetical protein